MALVKEPWEIACMRQSCRRLAEVVALLKERVDVGVSTAELDALAEEAIAARGGRSSFKGYEAGPTPFPAVICASVNDQVVHGFPNDRPLVDGDVISIDVGLIYGGYHSDCAFTVQVGEGTPEVAALLEATEKSLFAGVAQALAGNRIGDVGHAIESVINPHGYGIIREYVGHGIGRSLHETPSVPNFGRPHRGSRLRPGMCLAIEPMITLGGHATEVLDDGWTVVTRDGSLAAHFEHTIVVTARGPEVLTVLSGEGLYA